MPQVDFYILPEQGIPPRLVCNLTSKVRAEGCCVHIQARDRDEASQLDNSLWTFRDISFLPHVLADDTAAAQHTITIGWPEAAHNRTEVLINLTQTEPEDSTGYRRIMEIVSAEPTSKARARQLYRCYRDKGYDLNTHEISPGHG